MMTIRWARIGRFCNGCSPRAGIFFFWVLLVGVVWATLNSRASAIDVSEYRWGFNGKVAPHRFNVLSVLVNNPGSQQFTGTIRLNKTLGAGMRVDAEIYEEVTITPYSSRWVQFYPYITSENRYGGPINETWYLHFEGDGGGYKISEPRAAKYQRVILDDPTSVSARGGSIKFHLPDNLFPPFVIATDSLQLAVLDHIPRWEPTRQQSFLDWLYLGGTVVVLHDVSGKFPEFEGAMGVLKTPLEDQMYGAGRVLKIPVTRSQFGDDQLRQACAGLPKNVQVRNATEKTDDIVDQIDETQPINQNQNQNYADGGYSDGSDPFKSNSFLSQLKQMTKPDHNWVLLHFMFWIYIGLVFPGCYLLGKKWSDFRVVYAGLLGTVGLFSMLFSYVGQRGYGEATAVHTVAIARPLSDGTMDVTSWSNIFVTGGAKYHVRHNAKASLYSTCNEHEEVKGYINNGTEGNFLVDIPPFSNRELASRTKIHYAGPSLTIDSIKYSEGQLKELELSVDGLQREDVERQCALVGNTFYSLSWKDGKLMLANEIGNVVGMLRVGEKQNQYQYNYPMGYEANKQTPAERYTQMFDILLSRALSVSREKDAEQIRLPANMIRVFLYAKITSEFAIQEKQNRFTDQKGRVLYDITLSNVDLKQP